MGVAFADFGWSSEQFWNLTFIEFLCALNRKFPTEEHKLPAKSGRITKKELDESIKKYGRTITLDS